MKKILILVAGQSNLPLIQTAKDLGFYVITCDNNPLNPGHRIANENIFIDVYNDVAIIEAIKGKNIDAVMTFVSSHGLNTISMIADYFKLNGYTPEALKTLTDKALFRDFLSQNHLNFPSYQCVKQFNEIDFEQITYPIIIKPTDKGGSQGVVKVNNKDELVLNFESSKDISDSKKVIIEEFLEGEKIINGDCIIFNGNIIGSIMGNYIYDNDTNNVLPIATLFGTKYDENESLNQITRIVKKLNIPNGIINFEAIIKDNKPYIVEINPRPSGNYIWKLMGYKYEIDIPKLLIQISLNKNSDTINLTEHNNSSYAYQLIYSNKDKVFKGFETPSIMKSNIIEEILFKQPNERISKFNNLFDRIGLLLMKFNDEKEINLYIRNTKLFRI